MCKVSKTKRDFKNRTIVYGNISVLHKDMELNIVKFF